MKIFMKKNKVLFWAAAIVLAGGVCLAVMLISQTHGAMTDDIIQTAQAEADNAGAAPSAEPTPNGAPMPQPTAVSEADMLGSLIAEKEIRRAYVIPSVDCSVVNEAGTWKITEPKDFDTLKKNALPKAADFAKAFFGYNITDDKVDYRYYTDTSGHRGDIIRISTKDEAVVCTLAAETLDLINIDYYFVPGSTQTEPDFYSNKISDSTRDIAGNVAAVFDTAVSDIQYDGSSGGKGTWANTYELKMQKGKLARFAMMNGTLYAVGIYPSEASLKECAYFDADVQYDSSLVKLASEQNFAAGKPGTGDMTQEQALRIYETFLKLSNGDGQYATPLMTFYVDNSGTRENFWRMKGNKLNMDIASKSKWIVSLTCSGLWNPQLDLTKTEEIGLGGHDYENYIANIMSNIYGEDFLYAGVNGITENNCTEDAWMADGTVYEFEFVGGKLQQVYYFADENCFRYTHSGWKADHEYVSSVTGETFIPN